MLNRLFQVMNVRDEEVSLVGLMLLHSFFVGVPRIFAATVANTRFLSDYNAGLLPLIYIASAVLNPLIAFGLARLGRRLNFTRFLLLNLVLQVTSLLAFRVLFDSVEAAWPSLAFAIWFEVLWVLSGLQFWSLAGRLFDIRQGKRLFALIGSGEVIAFMLMGTLGGSIIAFFGVDNLLILAAIGAVGSTVMVVIIARRMPPPRTDALRRPRDAQPIPGRARQWYRQPYVQLIFVLAGIAYAVFFFVDNVFFTQVESQFTETDALASFLIAFAAISGFTNLMTRLLISERFISRYGVRGGLLILPIVLTVGGATIVLSGLLAAPAALIFVLAAVLKLSDQVLRYSINDAAILVLFQPLASRDQVRVQSATESVVEPVTGGLTGILLLLLVNVLAFDSIALYGVVLLLTVIWLWMARRTSFAYRNRVVDALRFRRFGAHSLSFADAASVQILKDRLSSDDATEAIYALTALVEANLPDRQTLVLGQITHPDARVREHALEIVEAQAIGDATPQVKALIRDEADPVVRAAAIRALAAIEPEGSFDDLTLWLQDSSAEVREAASVGLLRYGGIEGVLAAGYTLIDMTQSADATRRAEAATILGSVGVRNFYRPLLRLIPDESPVVANAAILAAGRVGNQRLWPLVIQRLAASQTRSAAVVALSQADEAILELFEATFADQNTPPRTLMELATIAGRLGTAAAQAFLLRQAKVPNLNVRLTVIKALSSTEYRAVSAESQAEALAAMREDVQTAAWALALIEQVLNGPPPTDLIESALHKEVDESIVRAFYWLSFCYDRETILQALDNIHQPGNVDRATVLEALEQVLPTEIKRIVFPLIETIPLAQQLARLRETMPVPVPGLAQALTAIIQQRDRWIDPWLRAAAIHAASGHQDETLKYAVIGTLNDSDLIVAEAAFWAINRLAPSLYRLKLTEMEQKEARGSTTATEYTLLTTATRLSKEYAGGRRMLLTIEKVIILKSVSIFSQTSEEFLAQIAMAMREIELEPGEVLIQQGDEGDCMYVIVEGSVRVHIGDRTVAVLGRRDFLGDLALLDDEPRSASATILESTRLLRLDSADFHELIYDYPEVARGIMRVLAQRLRQAIR